MANKQEFIIVKNKNLVEAGLAVKNKNIIVPFRNIDVKLPNDADLDENITLISERHIKHPDFESNIKDGSITTSKIANKAVTKEKLADDIVDDNHITAKSIITDKIADKAVTEPKLADNAVSTRTVINKSITKEKMAGDAIDSEMVVDKAINTAKLADKAVTLTKLADEVNNLHNQHITRIDNNKKSLDNKADKDLGNVDSDSIDTNLIKDEAVTEAKLASAVKTKLNAKGSGGTGVTDLTSLGRIDVKANAVSIYRAVTDVGNYKIYWGGTSASYAFLFTFNDAYSWKHGNVVDASGTILTFKLTSDGTFTTTQVKGGGSATINDGAITTAKLANKSVTEQKLTDSVVNKLFNKSDYFTKNSEKLTKNDTSANPGLAYIGRKYKGAQFYGYEASGTQHYGYSASSSQSYGFWATGAFEIGKTSWRATTNPKLYAGQGSNEYAEFKDIVKTVKSGGTPADGSVTEAKLASNVQTKLNRIGRIIPAWKDITNEYKTYNSAKWDELEGKYIKITFTDNSFDPKQQNDIEPIQAGELTNLGLGLNTLIPISVILLNISVYQVLRHIRMVFVLKGNSKFTAGTFYELNNLRNNWIERKTTTINKLEIEGGDPIPLTFKDDKTKVHDVNISETNGKDELVASNGTDKATFDKIVKAANDHIENLQGAKTIFVGYLKGDQGTLETLYQDDTIFNKSKARYRNTGASGGNLELFEWDDTTFPGGIYNFYFNVKSTRDATLSLVNDDTSKSYAYYYRKLGTAPNNGTKRTDLNAFGRKGTGGDWEIEFKLTNNGKEITTKGHCNNRDPAVNEWYDNFLGKFTSTNNKDILGANQRFFLQFNTYNKSDEVVLKDQTFVVINRIVSN